MNELEARYYDGAFAAKYPEFADQAKAAAQAVGSIASGIAASVPAGIAGVAALPFKGMDGATQLINDLQTALTYIPDDPESQAMVQRIGGALEMLGVPAKWIGEKTLEATGSPAAATTAEMVLDPVNLAGAGAVAAAGKAAKKVSAKSGAGVGASVAGAAAMSGSEDAEALPLSRAVSAAIRNAGRNATRAELEAAMRAANPSDPAEKISRFAKYAESVNKELGDLPEDHVVWSGKIGTMKVGNPEMGAAHVMIEHHGDIKQLLITNGTKQSEADKMSHMDMLTKALELLDRKGVRDGDAHYKIGKTRVRVVKSGQFIGTLYPEK